MLKPRFQFSLDRLFLTVGAVAVVAGVLRVLWGTMALVIVVAFTGLGCIFFGAGKLESNASPFSVLVVLGGVFLIGAAICGGFMVQGID